MDGVELMNRIDAKYIMPVSMIPSLLNSISNVYRVLEINLQREFNYNTIYFDTPDYLFFNQHLTGKMGRYKVRLRTYEATSLSYLEVKYKSNKGRTSKTRIKREKSRSCDDEKSQKFLNDKVRADVSSLQPVVTSLFTRITLVNLASAERITIDYNLAYINNNGERVELPYLAIAEIKKDKASGISLFHQQLKKMGIRQTGISKYCTGIVLLNDVPRKNNFKPKLLMLNKIKNEYTKYDVA